MLECNELQLTEPFERCTAPSDHLEEKGDPRFNEYNDLLHQTYDNKTLWDTFGIVADVMVRIT